MNKKTASLLLLLLCLVGGLGALLSVLKDDGAGAADEGGMEVAQSAPQTGAGGELEAFEGAERARDVAPSSATSAQDSDSIADTADSSGVVPTPFTGKVVGSRGEPIVGAEVLISRNYGRFRAFGGEQTAKPLLTDASGVFLVKTLPRRDLKIEIEAVGYALFSENLARPEVGSSNLPAEQRDLGVFTLEPGVILRGVVLDFYGAPVPDVALHVEAVEEERGFFYFAEGLQEEPDAVSSQDGTFSLNSVPLGPWLVTSSHDLYPAKEVTGISESPGLHPSSVRIQLPESGVIRGVVKGAGEGGEYQVVAERAASGWEEINFNREAEINEDGSFELQGLLSEENYELFVLEKDEHMSFGEPLSSRVPARTGDSGVVLEMSGATGLKFRVVHVNTGEPIEDFRAEAGSWGTEPLRGAKGEVLLHHPDGQARFENIRQPLEEKVQLKVVAEGYEAHSSTVTKLVRGEVLDLGEIKLKPAPLLRLRVLSEADGTPVHNARVSLSTARDEDVSVGGFGDFGGAVEISNFGRGIEEVVRTGQTDEDGWLSLTTIPGFACILKAQHGKYADLTLPTREYAGGEVEMRMLSGGAVRVLVLTADGAPASGVEVSHREMKASGYDSKNTNSTGEAVFRHLKAATHSFRLEEDRGLGAFVEFGGMDITGSEGPLEDGWEAVEITEGADLELVLHQVPRGVLFGRVTEGGRALPGATLKLEPYSGEGSDAEALRIQMSGMIFFGGGGGVRTKGDGTYRMDETDVGEYELVVSHSSRVMDERVRVTLTPGEVEFHVDLPSTIIEGLVVNQDGDPVEGVQVSVHQPRGVKRRGMAMIMGSTGGAQFQIGSGGDSGVKRTNGAGEFRIKGVAAGCELELEVRGGNYQTETIELSPMRPDEVRRGVRVVLIEGGGIEVTLILADGRSPSFASIALHKLVDGEPQGEARHEGAEGGSVSFEGLAPGEWTIEATVHDFTEGGEPEMDTQEKVVVVKAGEISRLTLQF